MRRLGLHHHRASSPRRDFVMATARHLFVIAARARNSREVARKSGLVQVEWTAIDLSPPRVLQYIQ